MAIIDFTFFLVLVFYIPFALFIDFCFYHQLNWHVIYRRIKKYSCRKNSPHISIT